MMKLLLPVKARRLEKDEKVFDEVGGRSGTVAATAEKGSTMVRVKWHNSDEEQVRRADLFVANKKLTGCKQLDFIGKPQDPPANAESSRIIHVVAKKLSIFPGDHIINVNGITKSLRASARGQAAHDADFFLPPPLWHCDKLFCDPISLKCPGCMAPWSEGSSSECHVCFGDDDAGNSGVLAEKPSQRATHVQVVRRNGATPNARVDSILAKLLRLESPYIDVESQANVKIALENSFGLVKREMDMRLSEGDTILKINAGSKEGQERVHIENSRKAATNMFKGQREKLVGFEILEPEVTSIAETVKIADLRFAFEDDYERAKLELQQHTSSVDRANKMLTHGVGLNIIDPNFARKGRAVRRHVQWCMHGSNLTQIGDITSVEPDDSNHVTVKWRGEQHGDAHTRHKFDTELIFHHEADAITAHRERQHEAEQNFHGEGDLDLDNIDSFLGGFSDEQMHQKAAKAFRELDANADGQVTLEEFERKGLAIMGGDTEALKAQFAMFDRDGDGVITTAEYAQAYKVATSLHGKMIASYATLNHASAADGAEVAWSVKKLTAHCRARGSIADSSMSVSGLASGGDDGWYWCQGDRVPMASTDECARGKFYIDVELLTDTQGPNFCVGFGVADRDRIHHSGREALPRDVFFHLAAQSASEGQGVVLPSGNAVPDAEVKCRPKKGDVLSAELDTTLWRVVHSINRVVVGIQEVGSQLRKRPFAPYVAVAQKGAKLKVVRSGGFKARTSELAQLIRQWSPEPKTLETGKMARESYAGCAFGATAHHTVAVAVTSFLFCTNSSYGPDFTATLYRFNNGPRPNKPTTKELGDATRWTALGSYEGSISSRTQTEIKLTNKFVIAPGSTEWFYVGTPRLSGCHFTRITTATVQDELVKLTPHYSTSREWGSTDISEDAARFPAGALVYTYAYKTPASLHGFEIAGRRFLQERSLLFAGKTQARFEVEDTLEDRIHFDDPLGNRSAKWFPSSIQPIHSKTKAPQGIPDEFFVAVEGTLYVKFDGEYTIHLESVDASVL